MDDRPRIMETIGRPGTDDRKTLTARNKATVKPTRKVVTDDRTEATGAIMADPIIRRMEVPRAVTDVQTRTGTTGAPTADSTPHPRVMKDGMMTLTKTGKVFMVDLRKSHRKNLEATTNDPTTPTGAVVVVMVDRTTTATVDSKIRTDLTTPLALMAVRRRAELVREGCGYPVLSVC